MLNVSYAPYLGRLSFKGSGNKVGGWSPASYLNEWIQVDLGQTMKISQIRTQGRHKDDRYDKCWTKLFTVFYSYDGETYENYKHPNGNTMVSSLCNYKEGHFQPYHECEL